MLPRNKLYKGVGRLDVLCETADPRCQSPKRNMTFLAACYILTLMWQLDVHLPFVQALLQQSIHNTVDGLYFDG